MSAYLYVAAFVAVIFGPAILSVLQMFGVKWAFAVGFPVGTFRKRDDLSDISESTEWVRIKEGRGGFVISEQDWRWNPSQTFWNSRFPDKLIGTAVRHRDESVLVLRADPITCFSWISFVIFALVMVVVPRVPGVGAFESIVFPIAVVVGCVTGLVYFVRRTRRRAVALAKHLGFPTIPSSR